MAASGSGPLGRGLDISLAALRRHDPYIQSILDVASQVALYTFSHRANEWEKTDVEGTLFVYTRSASPKHGFTIMNRLSMDNRTEPITKDLEFQLQDPFLLYRNARFLIYGIWFYDKEECQRIGELMKNLTQQEQAEARHVDSVSPLVPQSDVKEVDILQMLNKAKDEYTKCKSCCEPKMITSSSAIHTNPNLIKPIAVKPSDASPRPTHVQNSKSGDPEPRHLSLTVLFGKAEKAACETAGRKDSSAPARPGVVRSLSYEDPSRLADGGDKQLCPAIQKLMVRGGDLLPVSEIPEKQQDGSALPPGDVFSGLFLSADEVFPAHEPGSGDALLHRLTASALLQPDPGRCYCTEPAPAPRLQFYDPPQQSQRTPTNLPTIPPPAQAPPQPGTISPQELLKKLNLVRQDQQLQAGSKPTLAAKFPVVSQATAKPDPGEELPVGEKRNPLLQVISPQRIPATVSPSLLLSPLVFTQTSAQRSTDVTKSLFSDADAASNLLHPLTLSNAPSQAPGIPNHALTKSQLCDTLVHLIQNDDSFLNTIYETYLSVLKGKF
ncbi:mRNA-decapping enzyme 1B [Gastrophryne carolinensis]